MSQKRPCSECGHTEFMVLPNIVLAEISKAILGGGATQRLPGSLHITLVVCGNCKKSDLYTTNADALMNQVPEARTVSATSS